MTTTTNPDYLALLRNVLHAPHDDLPRLVLADWLDEPEHAGSVPCHHCGGPEPDGTYCYAVNDQGDCDTCNGTGYVSNGNAERAEFIRLQCEIARIDAPTLSEIASGAYPTHKELRLRERALWAGPSVGSWFPGRLGVTYSRAVHDSFYDKVSGFVSRGFVGSIRLTAEQFMQHAAALFREHPITEVVLSNVHIQAFLRVCPNSHRVVGAAIIPDAIYWEMTGYSSTSIYRTWRAYPTREAALAALSLACVRVGRRLAGLPEEYAQG